MTPRVKEKGGRALALTGGDPAGIGPDIAILAWLRRRETRVPSFYLLSDPSFIASRAKRLGIQAPIAEVTAGTALDAFEHSLPVVPLNATFRDAPGQPDSGQATAVIESIDRAVADVQACLAAAVVTGPIAKKTLYDAGFSFPGHTEYLAHLADAPRPVMMIAGPSLRTIPVTIHEPLAAVPVLLKVDLIVETVRVADRDLRRRFGIRKPRLAVAGLNPHAGEGGTIGRQEQTIIGPAIEILRSEGIDASGPYPADTMFHAEARKRYDAAVCMYHDQALIPAKTLAFDKAVNVTLGLPFVRTSPDHGTAFDIAGTGKARPDSLIAALKLADKMSRRP